MRQIIFWFYSMLFFPCLLGMGWHVLGKRKNLGIDLAMGYTTMLSLSWLVITPLVRKGFALGTIANSWYLMSGVCVAVAAIALALYVKRLKSKSVELGRNGNIISKEQQNQEYSTYQGEQQNQEYSTCQGEQQNKQQNKQQGECHGIQKIEKRHVWHDVLQNARQVICNLEKPDKIILACCVLLVLGAIFLTVPATADDTIEQMLTMIQSGNYYENHPYLGSALEQPDLDRQNAPIEVLYAIWAVKGNMHLQTLVHVGIPIVLIPICLLLYWNCCDCFFHEDKKKKRVSFSCSLVILISYLFFSMDGTFGLFSNIWMGKTLLACLIVPLAFYLLMTNSMSKKSNQVAVQAEHQAPEQMAVQTENKAFEQMVAQTENKAPEQMVEKNENSVGSPLTVQGSIGCGYKIAEYVVIALAAQLTFSGAWVLILLMLVAMLATDILEKKEVRLF